MEGAGEVFAPDVAVGGGGAVGAGDALFHEVPVVVEIRVRGGGGGFPDAAGFGVVGEGGDGCVVGGDRGQAAERVVGVGEDAVAGQVAVGVVGWFAQRRRAAEGRLARRARPTRNRGVLVEIVRGVGGGFGWSGVGLQVADVVVGIGVLRVLRGSARKNDMGLGKTMRKQKKRARGSGALLPTRVLSRKVCEAFKSNVALRRAQMGGSCGLSGQKVSDFSVGCVHGADDSGIPHGGQAPARRDDLIWFLARSWYADLCILDVQEVFCQVFTSMPLTDTGSSDETLKNRTEASVWAVCRQQNGCVVFLNVMDRPVPRIVEIDAISGNSLKVLKGFWQFSGICIIFPYAAFNRGNDSACACFFRVVCNYPVKKTASDERDRDRWQDNQVFHCLAFWMCRRLPHKSFHPFLFQGIWHAFLEQTGKFRISFAKWSVVKRRNPETRQTTRLVEIQHGQSPAHSRF